MKSVFKNVMVLVMALSFLTGCTGNAANTTADGQGLGKIPKYTWETENHRVQMYSDQVDYAVTEVNGLHIELQDDNWSDEEKNRLTREMEVLATEVRQMMEVDMPAWIYVGNSLTTMAEIDDGKAVAYVKTEDLANGNGAAAMFQAFAYDGRVSHLGVFGEAYGLASLILKNYKTEILLSYAPVDGVEDVEDYIGQLLNQSTAALDLYQPQFETVWNDERTISSSQKLAYSFALYLMNERTDVSALYLRDGANFATLNQEMSDLKSAYIHWWFRDEEARHDYRGCDTQIDVKPSLTEQRSTYPYVARTEQSNWYFRNNDVESWGYFPMMVELGRTLEYQDADFAEAREVLKGYIVEDVPVIDIYTDFLKESIASEVKDAAAAMYFDTSNYIKLFGDWEMCQYTLLHEYVHYLTVSNGATVCGGDFFCEAVAEYVSMFACNNRMADYISHDLDEETYQIYKKAGLWSEDEQFDFMAEELGLACLCYKGYADDSHYLCLAAENYTRTKEFYEHFKLRNLSYYEGATMIAYMIETYGKDAVFSQWDGNGDFATLYGDPHEVYESAMAWGAEKLMEKGIDIHLFF